MNKLFALLAIALFFSISLSAQDAIIFGIVTDTNSVPIKDVNVVNLNTNEGDVTNYKGYYELKVKENKPTIIQFSHTTYLDQSFSITPKPFERIEINVKMSEASEKIEEIIIRDKALREVNLVAMNPRLVTKFAGVSITGIETMLKMEAGVSSTSELSSQYNVRGGSFDENMIFVNNLPIYKPLLISAGRQEGLSFVNPNLTESIVFSAGGFEAQYGDKMSSVLDITYKKPENRVVGLDLSFMGGSLTYGNCSKDSSHTHISSFRYKNTDLLLNGLKIGETEIFKADNKEGIYKPSFYDFQSFHSYKLNKKWKVESIIYGAINNYVFLPIRKETVSLQNGIPQTFTMYFEGNEKDRFGTYMASLSLHHSPKINIKNIVQYSATLNNEKETYDILAEYWLEELKKLTQIAGNIDSLNYLDVGRSLTHARNEINSVYHNLLFNSSIVLNTSTIKYGAGAKYETFSYHVDEWTYIDSGAYNYPYSESKIQLFEVLKSNLNHNYTQFFAYGQNTYRAKQGNGILAINGGIRLNYRPAMNEFLVSPRGRISYRIEKKRVVILRISGGLYHQTPFFKEMIAPHAVLMKDIESQKSIHVVAGTDIDLTLWGRPFKFIGETYYKHIYNLIPYNIDNVKIEYLPQLKAKGYATGIDMKLNGEFIEGTESWITMSLLKTMENIEGDTLRDGTDAGWIRRPTDQLLNMGLFFQDYLPMNDSYKVNLTFMFGTKLPTGMPSDERVYKDAFSIPRYRRVDMGISKILIDRPNNSKGFDYLSIGAEIFNLLNITNKISYLWIRDVEGNYRAVPNNLTSRSINLKLTAKI